MADLGATSLLIAHQPTLRDALASAARQIRNRINSTLIMHVEDIGNDVLIREDFSLKEPEPSRQACDLALGRAGAAVPDRAGQHWCPSWSVSPTSAAAHRNADLPAPVPLPRGVQLRIQRYRARTADLDRPNPEANSALADHARRLIDIAMSAERQSIAQQVEQSIRCCCPAGAPTSRPAPTSLGLTVRTLQRMLDAEAGAVQRAAKQGADAAGPAASCQPPHPDHRHGRHAGLQLDRGLHALARADLRAIAPHIAK